MAIPSRPLSQDPVSQQLWNISKQMEQLIAQVGAVVKNTAPSTTTTTTTQAPSLFSGNVKFHPDAAGACSGIGASVIAVTGDAATFCNSTALSGAGIATGLPTGMTFRASAVGDNQVYNVIRNEGSTVVVTSACTTCP